MSGVSTGRGTGVDMTIITHHTVRCPYCGHEKNIAIESEQLEKIATFHCRGAIKSSPGCDRVYAVQLVLLPKVTIYELVPGSYHQIEETHSDPRWDIPQEAVQ
jgi:hypothetical protein